MPNRGARHTPGKKEKPSTDQYFTDSGILFSSVRTYINGVVLGELALIDNTLKQQQVPVRVV